MREDTKKKLYDMNLAELISAVEEQEKNPLYASMTFTERLDIVVDMLAKGIEHVMEKHGIA